MQKLGKRKAPAGQKQPDWLFPSNTASSATPKTQSENRLKNKKDQQLAKDLLKRRDAGEPPKATAPLQLLKLVYAFLNEYDFAKTARALKTESKGLGETVESSESGPSLSTIYEEWRGSRDQNKKTSGEASEAKPVKLGKTTEPESDTSDSESSSDESDVEMADAALTKDLSNKQPSSMSSSATSSSSGSDSDADEEAKPEVNGLKRKAVSSDESSSGSDSSDSDSDSDDGHKSKKLKPEVTLATPESDSSSDESSSESDSSSDDEIAEAKKSAAVDGSSDRESSSSDSESDSDSDSDSSTNSVAQKVPLPESDSDSSSESDNESSVEGDKKKPIIASDTSATLSDGPKKMSPSDSDPTSSSDSDANEKIEKTTVAKRVLSPPLPPSPAPKQLKKTNERFSRIPKDIKVEERLQSNAYVPYDYAQKAHEDLIVTRGKGFTKEKNKKKRGSYKGGYIDIEGKKGIKFDD